MPSSELIKILRTGAQGLEPSVKFLILDACDRLERQIRDNDLLMQKIVELRSKGKWIPVTERLPSDDIPSTMYLCYWNGIIRVCKYWRTRKCFELMGKVVKVAHWMPLPEPPKD